MSRSTEPPDPADHLGLACMFARQFWKGGGWRHLRRDDLLQIASLAVVRAAKTYDASKGVAFSTYAGSYIQGYLKTARSHDRRIVQFSQGSPRTLRRVLLQSPKDRFSPEVVRQALRILDTPSEELVQRAVGWVYGHDISLDDPAFTTSEGDRQGAIEDCLSDETALDDIEQVDAAELTERVLALADPNIIDRERARALLTERILADAPVTLRELGARWGVTPQAAQSQERRLLNHLRDIYFTLNTDPPR